MTNFTPKYKLVTGMLLIIFWYTGTISFPLQEIMPSAFTALNPYIMAFGDVMLMCLGLWTLRSRLDIALLISLILIGFASKQLNDVSFLSYVNGMRQYVDLVFILSIIRYLLATRTRIEYFCQYLKKYVLVSAIAVPCNDIPVLALVQL